MKMAMTKNVKKKKKKLNLHASPTVEVLSVLHYTSKAFLISLFLCSGLVPEPKSQVETSRKNGH